jgi:Zn-dependent protease with chaperone function
MRLDRANRSFLAGVGIATPLAAIVLCGALGGVLLPLILAGKPRPTGSSLPALAFVALVALGLGSGARSLARQVLASRRLARRVRRLVSVTPDDLRRAAADAGLAERVVLIDAGGSFSFVHGVLTPRVVVSRGLLVGASSAELRAVLAHERYHVCNLDPLKTVVLRSLSATFFFLPLLDVLRVRHLVSRELAADRSAVIACGRAPLAGALLKVVRGPGWPDLNVAAPLAGDELLDARVAQLETGAEPTLGELGFKPLLVSILGVAALAAAFLAAVASFGAGALRHATGAVLVDETLRGGLLCGAPFVAAGLLAYWLIALRARRPSTGGRRSEAN